MDHNPVGGGYKKILVMKHVVAAAELFVVTGEPIRETQY